MNELSIKAFGLKKYLERHPTLSADEKKAVTKEIQFYENVATYSRKQLLKIFDSTTYNNVLKGYMMMAMDEVRLRKEKKREISEALRFILDTVDAEEAEHYYLVH